MSSLKYLALVSDTASIKCCQSVCPQSHCELCSLSKQAAGAITRFLLCLRFLVLVFQKIYILHELGYFLSLLLLPLGSVDRVRLFRTNIDIRNIQYGKPNHVWCWEILQRASSDLFCSNLFIVGADTTHDQVVGYGHLFELCPPCVRCLNVSYSYYNPHFPPLLKP